MNRIPFKKTLLSLALVSVLSACGGGGDSIPGSDETDITLGGKVIDGYIRNASVYLDCNDNAQLDSGEPSTTSGEGGVYSLSITTSQATAGCSLTEDSVLTEIGSDALDEDYSTEFTLAELGILNAGEKVILKAPPLTAEQAAAESPTANVTPITTLVATKLDVLKASDPTKTSADAVTALQTDLVTGDFDLLGDYVLDKDSADTTTQTVAANLHTLAQTVTVLMADSQVDSTSGVSVADQVAGLTGSVLDNLATIKTAVISHDMDDASTTDLTPTAGETLAEKLAETIATESPELASSISVKAPPLTASGYDLAKTLVVNNAQEVVQILLANDDSTAGLLDQVSDAQDQIDALVAPYRFSVSGDETEETITFKFNGATLTAYNSEQTTTLDFDGNAETTETYLAKIDFTDEIVLYVTSRSSSDMTGYVTLNIDETETVVGEVTSVAGVVSVTFTDPVTQTPETAVELIDLSDQRAVFAELLAQGESDSPVSVNSTTKAYTISKISTSDDLTISFNPSIQPAGGLTEREENILIKVAQGKASAYYIYTDTIPANSELVVRELNRLATAVAALEDPRDYENADIKTLLDDEKLDVVFMDGTTDISDSPRSETFVDQSYTVSVKVTYDEQTSTVAASYTETVEASDESIKAELDKIASALATAGNYSTTVDSEVSALEGYAVEYTIDSEVVTGSPAAKSVEDTYTVNIVVSKGDVSSTVQASFEDTVAADPEALGADLQAIADQYTSRTTTPSHALITEVGAITPVFKVDGVVSAAAKAATFNDQSYDVTVEVTYDDVTSSSTFTETVSADATLVQVELDRIAGLYTARDASVTSTMEGYTVAFDPSAVQTVAENPTSYTVTVTVTKGTLTAVNTFSETEAVDAAAAQAANQTAVDVAKTEIDALLTAAEKRAYSAAAGVTVIYDPAAANDKTDAEQSYTVTATITKGSGDTQATTTTTFTETVEAAQYYDKVANKALKADLNPLGTVTIGSVTYDLYVDATVPTATSQSVAMQLKVGSDSAVVQVHSGYADSAFRIVRVSDSAVGTPSNDSDQTDTVVHQGVYTVTVGE